MERARRRQRRARWLFGGACAVVVVVIGVAVGLVIAFSGGSGGSGTGGIPSRPRLTAAGATANPPWAAPADATARVRIAGLPMLSSEGTVEHIHAHLDVRVDGQAVAVPADLGTDQSSGTISPVHTHDTTGVVHIESPIKADFSLGQLFTEWNVSLSTDRLGALTTGGGTLLRAYLNGRPYDGDPAGILMHAHDEIALVYGTPAQQTGPPSSYSFPAGE
jgi:hypothetical protein